MAGVVEKDVFRFQIAGMKGYFVFPHDFPRSHAPVNNVKLMQVLQRQQELCAVEPASLLIETLFALKMVEELSTVNETV